MVEVTSFDSDSGLIELRGLVGHSFKDGTAVEGTEWSARGKLKTVDAAVKWMSYRVTVHAP